MFSVGQGKHFTLPSMNCFCLILTMNTALNTFEMDEGSTMNHSSTKRKLYTFTMQEVTHYVTSCSYVCKQFEYSVLHLHSNSTIRIPVSFYWCAHSFNQEKYEQQHYLPRKIHIFLLFKRTILKF